MLTEKDIKKILIDKYNKKEFKFDKRTNQNFIEIINANFISNTGYTVTSHSALPVIPLSSRSRPLLSSALEGV